MKTITIAVFLLIVGPLWAQTTPDCPAGYSPCGNVCCPN
jgi:hypothetical protein